MLHAPSLRTDEFFTIFIKHLPTSEFVTFEGWVTDFSDQFSSNWNQQSVYGRMDPLVTFENTQRSITLGFDVVSDNAAQAESNLDSIANLIKFQYPVYESSERTAQNTLKAAPLIQMKWTNLLSDAKAREYLTGYLNGVTYAPVIADGGFVVGRRSRQELSVGGEVQELVKPISNPELFASTTRNRTGKEVIISNFDVSDPGKFFIPKKVSIQLTFNVLHTHLTGWYRNGESGGSFFFGSNELSAKYPNAVSKERIVSQTAAPANFGVGTINFDPAEEANNAQIVDGD